MHRNIDFNFTSKSIFPYLFILLLFYTFFPIFDEHYLFLFAFLLFIVFLIETIISPNKIKLSKNNIFTYFFFLFWLSYSLLTVYWAKDTKSVLLYSMRILCFFITFFLTTQFAKDKQKINFIIIILVIIYFSYLLISVWEIITLNHIPISHNFSPKSFSYIPHGPFYNENDFSAIIIILSPISFFLYKFLKYKVLASVLSLISIFLLFVITILQGSRIGLITLSFLTIIFAIFFTNLKEKINIIILFLLLVFIISTSNNIYIKIFRKYFIVQLRTINTEKQSYRLKSVKIRENLIKTALDMGFDSYLMGVGSGNFISEMSSDKQENTSGVLITHNFWMEVFSTNGLIIFLMLIIFYTNMIINLFRLIKISQNDKDKFLIWSFIFTLFLFLPASILPSTIFRYYHFWIIFGIIYSFIEQKKNYIYSEL